MIAASFVEVNTLLGVAVILAALGAGLYATRFKTSLDLARSDAASWKSERDAEKAHRERVDSENRTLVEELAKTTAEMHELASRPDIRQLYDLMKIHDEHMTVIANAQTISLEAVRDSLTELVGAARSAAREVKEATNNVEP